MQRLVLGLFPPPRFLEMRPIGLDLSDRSLKYAELLTNGRHLTLGRFGEKAIPIGLIESGQIKKRDELIAAFAALRAELGRREVVVSLPEEEAFVVELALPRVRPSEVREAIELQLEGHIPLKVTEVVFDYDVIEAGVSVSVFPRARLDDYLTILQAAGFFPLAAEIEAHAITRALVRPNDSKTYLIVDFGKTRTSFFISRQGTVLFTSTASRVAGEDITRAIQKTLNIEYAAAEAEKIYSGLLASRRREELAFAIVPILSVLRDEIAKLVEYWAGNALHQAAPIQEVVLTGGQSTLPGLVEYLGGGLHVPVRVGNVWENIIDINHTVPPLTLNESQRFATSFGLALRHFAS